MFRAAYRSSLGALTVFAASGLCKPEAANTLCKPEAANTVRAPDHERYAARNMLSLQ
jgi:hypothetical protein